VPEVKKEENKETIPADTAKAPTAMAMVK